MKEKFKKIRKALITALVVLVSGVLFCCGRDRETASVEIVEEERQELSTTKSTGTEGEEVAEPVKTLCVYVCGAVANPGVYELLDGSRIYEAVELAGGMTKEAEGSALNLAQPLSDGEKIQIPTITEVENGSYPSEDSSFSQNEPGKVNINLAGREELMTLPGIGEGKADSILKYRQEQGMFSNIEELMQVEGIKQGVYDKLKDKICI